VTYAALPLSSSPRSSLTRSPRRIARWSLRAVLATLAAAAQLLAVGCGPTVDCELLCQRTLACEVTFEAPDDPDEQRVASGERTEQESCMLGCQASPLVDVDTARCIDDLDTRDANVCQAQVLSCLEYDA
jgi:hypothetical protein